MMPHGQNDPGLTASHKSGPPVRQCAVTRERLPQTEMLRFGLSPDGVITPDVAGKLPGRGVWVTAKRDILDQAVKTKAFSRSLKEQVTVPDGLTSLVEQLLLKQCQGILGMGKKSGKIILGYDQVRDSIRKQRPGWLLEASEGAEDGRNKVHFLAANLYEEVKVAGAMSAAELGMAFGRDHVIHGLLKVGPLAKSWGVAYRRLIGFRPAPEEHWFQARDR